MDVLSLRFYITYYHCSKSKNILHSLLSMFLPIDYVKDYSKMDEILLQELTHVCDEVFVFYLSLQKSYQ